ncbi:MAG: alanine--glyoxylate aminotransferase family protein [Bacillota bacterium]|nr:alanine--glyoxylate aminotransferase family protein [Bacillota bacterium]
MKRKIISAGPTSINEKVLERMVSVSTNPDLDPEYLNFHREVERKYGKLLNTDATSFIVLGEAMIILEGSICSLMDKGDRVLVLSNGVFGAGFADYVDFFGGSAVLYERDHRHGFNIEELREFLEKDHDFQLATMVHCETPTGVTNDIKAIAAELNKYGILSIVDSVSAVGGEYIDFDDFGVDLILGGSQKAISAPTGLSMVTISDRAKEKIKNRKTKVPSYYMNFENYYNYSDPTFAFPYTMNEHLTYALDQALNLVLEKDFVALHKRYADITRKTVVDCGFELYAKDHHSNTLTAVVLPEDVKAQDLLEKMREKNIEISKGAGPMAEKLFRIGHMGNNISYENFDLLFQMLDQSFADLGHPLDKSLRQTFNKYYQEIK